MLTDRQRPTLVLQALAGPDRQQQVGVLRHGRQTEPPAVSSMSVAKIRATLSPRLALAHAVPIAAGPLPVPISGVVLSSRRMPVAACHWWKCATARHPRGRPGPAEEQRGSQLLCHLHLRLRMRIRPFEL